MMFGDIVILVISFKHSSAFALAYSSYWWLPQRIAATDGNVMKNYDQVKFLLVNYTCGYDIATIELYSTSTS